MAILMVEIRSGAYYDSVVLMHLQRSLSNQHDIIDAGVIMGTDANKDVLTQSGLLSAKAQQSGPDDLVIVVKAKDEKAGQTALDKVDELLTSRRQGGEDEKYHPKSLESAFKRMPAAQWVLISVPGRYAARVSRQALRLGRNVFLYSDNVSLDDEIELKIMASNNGLMVMGPDCGSAIINGVGLGFANKIQRGPIGIVAASGTGLQQVSVRIHQMGSGITHALGTGGRDLSEGVNAVTACQGLDLLDRDEETQAIILISKPPSNIVANDLIVYSRSLRKPVVIYFIGYATSTSHIDNLYFTNTFDETASLAIQLSSSPLSASSIQDLNLERFSSGQRYLRGLFSGGTLAYEALLILQNYLPNIYSNVPLDEKNRLPDSLKSKEHTIIDLGEDEFTVGRLHPMMDNDLRIRRLMKEAADPEVAVILLDVVLGYGAHPDPASELAPAIKMARKLANDGDRHLEIVVVISGTDVDPQDMPSQVKKLEEAGALVGTSNEAAASYIGKLLQALNPMPELQRLKPVNLSVLQEPVSAINVGLETFTESLITQGAQVIQVDWRPAAGGNEKLMSVLERMRS